MSLSVFEELRHVPERATDPNWLRELDKKEGEGR
jgi:hypothetical protein